MGNKARMKKLLTIIIVSYNTRNLLLDCLRSIYSYKISVPYEIIVVDNASSDDSVGAVKMLFPDAKLLCNKENMGFAKANNQAMKISVGDYVLLLNSDALITDNAIDRLLVLLEKNQDIFAVGPKVLNLDGTLQSKGNNFPSYTLSMVKLLRMEKILSEKFLYKMFPGICWPESELRKVDWVSGCCLLAKKTIIEKIGYLSEDYFFYGEDLEWCHRAGRSGYSVFYVPEAKIYHLGSGSGSNKYYDLMYDADYKLYKNIFGSRKGVVITINDIISCAISYISCKFRQRNNTNHYRMHIKYKLLLLRRFVMNMHAK